MRNNDILVTCLTTDARRRGVVVNTGWTNEARAASLAVRQAKAAARSAGSGQARASSDGVPVDDDLGGSVAVKRKKEKAVLSPEQAAFEEKVRSELQAMKEAWAAYGQAKSDEEKAAAEAKYPWLAKLNLLLGGSKVKPPEFPSVVPSSGANAKMYFEYLDSEAAAKVAKAATKQAKIDEKAMLDFIHWQSTQKAGLNIPLSEYQKPVAPPKDYSLDNDPFMTKAEKAAVRKMDREREAAATAVRKAKEAANKAEAAVIYGKGDVTALRAAHEAAKAAVQEAVEKQKKLGAPSSVQPAEQD